MYLSVSLKNGVDAQSFINKVPATIKAYRHLSNPEFKTWKVITITDKQKRNEQHYEVLSQKDTQLENIGCLIMLPSTSDKIRINFCTSINSIPEDEQKVMYFSRCVTMLRDHFGPNINSMSLLGL